MKNCRDIKNLLPLYPEGVLSDAEKRAVEEHLSGCAACQKELAYLQKAGDLVDELPQVEEPPWFQQKIMARVREEADKKSFAQKWFYPLRLKIPMQIMATLVIAFLAVYIYQSGDEQVKEILPGVRQPAIEMQKEQAPAQMPQVMDQAGSVIPRQKSAAKEEEQAPAQMPQAVDQAVPVIPRQKSAVREDVMHDKQGVGNITAGGSVQKSEAPESKPDAAYEADAYRAKGLTESKDEAFGALQAKQKETKSAKVPMAEHEGKAQDYAMPALAKKRESYKMAAPAAAPLQARVFVRVDDLNASVTNVEKVLTQYGAQKVTKQPAEGGVVIRAEVPGKSWKEVLSKLKEIGQVVEKVAPTDISERAVNVMIEISGP